MAVAVFDSQLVCGFYVIVNCGEGTPLRERYVERLCASKAERGQRRQGQIEGDHNERERAGERVEGGGG